MPFNIGYGDDGNNFYASSQTAFVYGGNGNDFIASSFTAEGDELYGGSGNDQLLGALWTAASGTGASAANAFFYTGFASSDSSPDFLDGGSGMDALYGANGNDMMFGRWRR